MAQDKTNTTYKQAGVDIDKGDESIRLIKGHIKKTLSNSVISSIGTFGALYDLKKIINRYKEPVLVQSIDSVGTKLVIANMANNHKTIGIDMVSHSCNDILCQGAQPLTFLDYIAVDTLKPEQIEQIVSGICTACRKVNLSVIGGEIAELPGVYKKGEYDLVGSITGVVDKEKIITGGTIKEGDKIIGLESNGLHTNGYSLARKVLFTDKKYRIDTYNSDLQSTLGEELLKPHRNYVQCVTPLLDKYSIKGIAHITGGGFKGNISRIIPNHLSACIRRNSWDVPPIFTIIQKEGDILEDEMLKTFNYGIGLVIITKENETNSIMAKLKIEGMKSFIIGEVINKGPDKNNAPVFFI